MTINQKFASGEIVRLEQSCSKCQTSQLFVVCLDLEAQCCQCGAWVLKPDFEGAEQAAFDSVQTLLATQARQLNWLSDDIEIQSRRPHFGKQPDFTAHTRRLVEKAQRIKMMADALYNRVAEPSL
ncbi:MAG TPA: hypothetical protein VLF41_02800 [Candidatus Nanoarchaeia archaeon]|nr:hypothetical protein [Candidatus Nanoarchaeia archaeon]